MMGKANIAVLEDMDYFTKEAFNTLRTNLRFSGPDIRTILLTSCIPSEGKSTTSFELCRSLAEDGKKVALVDLDLRRSSLVGRHHVTVEDGDIKGASHYLSGQVKIEEIVYSTNVEGLDIVFTGPFAPNPTGLLGNDFLERMMSYLRERYDVVIVDAPPLGTVVDAALIAPHCDGVILLIESHNISYRLAQRVKAQLEATGCRLLGVVLNKADVQHNGYYHYGYGHRYYKKYYEYSSQTEKKKK